MTSAVNRFYNSIDNEGRATPRDLVALFVYYLTVEIGAPVASAAEVSQCFDDCDLSPPSRLAAYLSEGLSSEPQRYVKGEHGGYKLQRHYREELSKMLGAERTVAQTSVELRRLESALQDGPKKAFLTETIDCFEAEANRAAVVMCWILTIDHLFDHVINHKLTEFNQALSTTPDKRVKKVLSREDLRELSESRFIEYLRAAGIISNDVRKILDAKLGTRNSCAHPSGVTIKRSKAIDFIEDLITNVVVAFPA
jgi:hypothetical protein